MVRNFEGSTKPELMGAIQSGRAKERSGVAVVECYGAEVLVESAVPLVARQSIRKLQVHRGHTPEGVAYILFIFRLQAVVNRTARRILEVSNTHVRINTRKSRTGVRSQAESWSAKAKQERSARVQSVGCIIGDGGALRDRAIDRRCIRSGATETRVGCTDCI